MRRILCRYQEPILRGYVRHVRIGCGEEASIGPITSDEYTAGHPAARPVQQRPQNVDFRLSFPFNLASCKVCEDISLPQRLSDTYYKKQQNTKHIDDLSLNVILAGRSASRTKAASMGVICIASLRSESLQPIS